MLLKDIYNHYSNYQMVLSFSNNNEVLITEDCFNPDSKFFRRSKIRLGVDFVVSGYIHGNTLIHTNQISSNESDVLIFRTYRGSSKNDYLLYLHKDYKVLESIRKKVSRKRVIKQTEHQMTMNEITKPIPDKTLLITPHMDGEEYFISYKHDGFKHGTFNSDYYKNPFSQNYLGYYAAVLLGLKVAKKYPDKITEVRIDVTQDKYVEAIGRISNNEWKPRNEYTSSYLKHFKALKQELEALKIAIRFIYKEEDKN